MKRIHKIQTCIYCNGKSFRKPESAAKALATATANALAGDGWHIDFDESLPEPEQQAKFEKEWDEYEATCERIEARAYPRFLKVCERILA
jgi:hypothetical protein